MSLQSVLALSQAGRTEEAISRCKQLTEETPEDADACHLLGVLLCGARQWDEGLLRLQQAVDLSPDNAEMQSNLGNALHAIGRTSEALSHFDLAIELNPHFAQTWVNRAIARRSVKNWQGALDDISVAVSLLGEEVYPELYANQGVIYSELGLQSDALTAFDAALRLRPNYFDVLRNKGLVLLALGDAEAALECFDLALKLKPAHVLLHADRGNALNALNLHEEAAAAHATAVRLDPSFAEGYANWSVALDKLGRIDQALQQLATAARLRPENGSIRYNYASLLLKAGDYTAGLCEIEAAIALGCQTAEALTNKGCLLERLGRYGDAWDTNETAIFIYPDHADLWSNRGVILTRFGRHQLAVAAFTEALKLKPDFGIALRSLAHTLKEIQRYDEARMTYERSIALGGDDAIEGQWALSLLHLGQGDFAAGWPLYEMRWQTKDFLVDHAKFLPLKLWQKEDVLTGKAVLIFCEQGLGDSIQFSRYLGLLVDAGAKVTLLAPKPLYELFSFNFSHCVSVVNTIDLSRPFDYRVPLLSLPGLFVTTVENVPSADQAYLKCPEQQAALWNGRLAASSGSRVGLMWSGKENAKLSDRSIPLSELSALTQLPVTWVSLQKEVRRTDEAALRLAQAQGLLHFGDQQQSFLDAAGIIEGLDLVISIDTGVAHLAAAMGKSTWIMLPYSADWRWLEAIEHSIWYPNVRLFRQTPERTWGPVIHRVVEALNDWRKSHSDS